MMHVHGGATDVTTYFKLRLAADGTDATGLTITNIDLQYVRSGATPSAKVDATALGAANSAHGDNQAIEVDATDQPGLYRVDWPDAAFAAGAREVILTVKCATAFTEDLRVMIDPPVNVEQIGGDSQSATDLKDFADAGYDPSTNKVTGVVTTDAATLVNGLANGVITTAACADGFLTDAKVANDLTVGSVTGAVGSVAGNVGGNVVGSVGSVAGNVSGTVAGVAGNVTGSVASVTGNVGGNVVGSVASVVGNVGGSVNSVVTGVTLAASAIQAIWDALTSALSTAGSIGKLLVDNINATISSRSSHSASDAATAVWANGTRTLSAFSFSVTVGTNSDKTGYSLATDGISAASLSTAAAEKQADITLRRRMSNVEASSFGDALHLSSFYGFVQMGQEASVSGGTMTVKQTDGSTTLGTKTVTGTAGADPITAIT